MYTMKETCEQTGLSYETLKFYCNQGLVPNVKRNKNNHRVFSEKDVEWIQSLNCLKNCGMGIAELKEYIELCLAGEATIPERKKILQLKQDTLREQMKLIQESIDYIDWKQGFYNDVLSGTFKMTLQDFFKQQNRVALAFSGGVDSAYLLYAGIKSGCNVHAYYVKSVFQPQFELDDAKKLAAELGAKMTVLELDVLSDPLVVQNPANRCYYCKKRIFGKIMEAAAADGYDLLIDGTNASDDAGDRPGMRALQELQVRSPLRECGITKEEVRKLSREAGLFTWDKPAYACLATRIPTGVEITSQKLQATENAEQILSEMGFLDFRIRLSGNDAKIQVKEEQLEKLLLHRKEILEKLKPYYNAVTVDLEVRS